MKRLGFFIAPLIAGLVLCPASAPAANRDMIELQRDVAQLQDQVRELQKSFDEKFTELKVLMQQTLESSNKSLQAMAEAGRNSDKIAAPIAGLNAKVDSMGNDVSGLRESVNDLTARMGKLQAQLTDLENIIKALQVPQAPPPQSGAPGAYPGQPSTGASDGSGNVVPNGVPPVKATTLYENALRDYQSGKADLALDEYQNYLKFYNDTDLAPNAQFYIGQIHFSQGQFDGAIQDFDKVLEAYPTNNKTADAHFMKGKALFQLGQRNAAAKEFQAVVRDFPNSDVAPNAKAQLRVLGINPAGTTKRR
jgi:tol-pal system protein YbgF